MRTKLHQRGGSALYHGSLGKYLYWKTKVYVVCYFIEWPLISKITKLPPFSNLFFLCRVLGKKNYTLYFCRSVFIFKETIKNRCPGSISILWGFQNGKLGQYSWKIDQDRVKNVKNHFWKNIGFCLEKHTFLTKTVIFQKFNFYVFYSILVKLWAI